MSTPRRVFDQALKNKSIPELDDLFVLYLNTIQANKIEINRLTELCKTKGTGCMEHAKNIDALMVMNNVIRIDLRYILTKINRSLDARASNIINNPSGGKRKTHYRNKSHKKNRNTYKNKKKMHKSRSR